MIYPKNKETMSKLYKYEFTCVSEGLRAVSVVIASNAKEAREEIDKLFDDYQVLYVRQEIIKEQGEE